METIGSAGLWAGFVAIVLVMLAIDLFLVGGGKEHRVSFKEAAVWSVIWISLSLAFAGGLWWHLDGTLGREVADTKALEFITGYLIEKALAVDNVFIWLMLFSFFAVPVELQKARPALWRAWRYHHAHDHDLCRRLADHPVPLDSLSIRCLPADHRRQDVLVRR
jgi:hypothetical protein